MLLAVSWTGPFFSSLNCHINYNNISSFSAICFLNFIKIIQVYSIAHCEDERSLVFYNKLFGGKNHLNFRAIIEPQSLGLTTTLEASLKGC